MDICGSDRKLAMICAGSSSGNQRPFPGKEAIRRSGPTGGRGDQNGCRHGVSRVRSEVHAYLRRGI